MTIVTSNIKCTIKKTILVISVSICAMLQCKILSHPPTLPKPAPTHSLSHHSKWQLQSSQLLLRSETLKSPFTPRNLISSLRMCNCFSHVSHHPIPSHQHLLLGFTSMNIPTGLLPLLPGWFSTEARVILLKQKSDRITPLPKPSHSRTLSDCIDYFLPWWCLSSVSGRCHVHSCLTALQLLVALPGMFFLPVMHTIHLLQVFAQISARSKAFPGTLF